MMRRHNSITSAMLCVLLGVIVAAATGCPRNREGTATVTTLFSTDASGLKTVMLTALAGEKGEVVPADIESLTVTVTKIDLLRKGDDDDSEEEETDESKGDNGGGPVVIFEGAVDVDLIDLTGISTVLSNAEIPAGEYTKIRMEIENPRLVLAADPETEITDIQLTANGRLFVNVDFELADGDEKLLLLDFGGLHLVETGNGSFVLTPQLSATLSLVDANVAVSGELLEVNTEDDLLVVSLPEGEATVDYSAAVIFQLTDTDTPTGTEANLIPGSTIEVTGLLQVDGTIVASAVRVLAAPGP